MAALRRHSPSALAAARIERERYRPGGCRFVLPISALVRDQILRRYPLAPERVRVLHPAVDLERFRPLPAAAGRGAARAQLGLPAALPAGSLGRDSSRVAGAAAALRQLPKRRCCAGSDRPGGMRRAVSRRNWRGGSVRFGARPILSAGSPAAAWSS
jgi:UDP-glucose:(heptosyl)LPS alpha-1,3-glucosyltransferase